MERKEDLESTVRVTTDLCISCGYCVDECLLDILELSNITGKVVVKNPTECNDCGQCVKVCEPQAIKLILP